MTAMVRPELGRPSASAAPSNVHRIEARRGRPSGLPLDPERMRAARARLGYTQEDLAELASVTSRTIQSAERGTRVAATVARSLARALRVSLSALVALDPDAVRIALAESGYGPLPPHEPVSLERDALERLVARLERGGVHTLVGGDGRDLTNSARAAAARAASSFSDGIVWVTARPGAAGLAQQADVARALSFEDRMPTYERVCGEAYALAFRMSLWSRRRLLVIDCAGGDVDLDYVRTFCGRPGEHAITVLVVTSSPELARGCAAYAEAPGKERHETGARRVA